MKKGYMRNLLSISLYLVVQIAYSQSNKAVDELLSLPVDSCSVSAYFVTTQEMLPIQGQPTERLLGSSAISAKDYRSLIRKLKRSLRQKQDRALTTHYNLVFDFYRKEALQYSITTSTMTGNLSVESGELEKHGVISKRLGIFLQRLLQKYHLLAHFDDVELQGLKGRNIGKYK